MFVFQQGLSLTVPVINDQPLHYILQKQFALLPLFATCDLSHLNLDNGNQQRVYELANRSKKIANEHTSTTNSNLDAALRNDPEVELANSQLLRHADAPSSKDRSPPCIHRGRKPLV